MSVPVRVRNLAKNFGRYPALKGVSLDVRAGELVALLGPSGSGKTTLLRAVAGLEQIAGGEVFFGDIDATSLSLRERRIGFVFQHYALFRHMRVFDNIAFGLRARPRASRPSSEAPVPGPATATFAPVIAASREARTPPEPAPMTKRS